MKVLFCAYDRPGHLATGPNAWLQRLVPDLRTQYGLDIHTLFIYGGDEQACPTLSYFKAKGLPLSTINREQWPYVADQVKQLLSLVKQLEIHVVVANLVIPAFYAARYLKKVGIPVIGVVHSNDAFYHGVIQKFIHGAQEDQLSHVVVVSDYLKKTCLAATSSTQILKIPCGTPLSSRPVNWKQGEDLKVMYAGRLVETQKQVLKLTQAFIAAAQNEPRLAFSIYGDGPEVNHVKALVCADGVDRVHYKGAVAPSAILNCFLEHQVFTLMSDYEGMPVALMEAMACGLVPVCLEEASGVNEIIEHGVNGFIVKNRDADYQNHLQRLLEEPGLWEKLSQNAKTTIAADYCSEGTHAQWAQLLRSFHCSDVVPLKLPERIKLTGPLLAYGDNRKPSQFRRIKAQWKAFWTRLRLTLRPRARLKNIFKG